MTIANNLPAQLTSFIGRHEEIVEVGQLLLSTRLLTITGAGGSGKTRFALQVASVHLDQFPDGVYFVDLAAVTDPALVPQAVAATLAVQEQSDRFLITTLVEQLRGRKVLLVLDNCEHVVSACSSIVYTLLRGCPDLQVLATSRQALDITGELVWRLHGLPVPEGSDAPPVEALSRYGAVQLFVERALFKRPDFALSTENVPAVVQICSLTDGLPLAIEMAAARVKELSVAQIAARLGSSLRLLTSGNTPALPRHRTLEAAIDWSYRLLSIEERELLRAVSVFAGTFTLEAAHAVRARADAASDEYQTLDLLSSLIDKSMVGIVERNGEVRYRLLETIRQYAAARAYAHDETADLHKKHLEWYLALAQKSAAHLEGPDQRAWFDRLEAEHDNLRKALFWMRAQDAQQSPTPNGTLAEAGLQMVKSLWRFWYARGHLTEARKWSEAALELAAHDKEILPTLRAVALANTGLLAHDQGDYAIASRLLNESLDLFRSIDDKQGISNCLNYLGVVTSSVGDYQQAMSLCEESLQLQRQLGSKPGIAACLNNLGYLSITLGNYASARTFVEECLAVLEELGDPLRTAIALNNLGRIACATGEYALAERLLLRCLSLRQELRDTKNIPHALSALGSVALHTERYEQAQSYLQQSLQAYRVVDDREGATLVLNYLGELARYCGREDEAWQYFEQAHLLARQIGHKSFLSLVLINVARACAARGDNAGAARSLSEALQLCLHMGGQVPMANCLVQIASLFNTAGETALAIRLLSYADHLLETSGFVIHVADQKELAGLIDTLRRKARQKLWATLWQEGRALSPDALAAEALRVVDVVQQRPGVEADTLAGGPRQTVDLTDLTRRELEVLRLLAEGLTDAEIAGKLFLSPHTVHAHLHSIYSKLDVTRRSAAVRFAIDNGLA